MAFVSAADGAQIFFKDWGDGPPIVLSHGWPLTADSWDAPMVELVANGQRCIAHDRRGHGRSSQTWAGNDMDTAADDLATLVETLDLPRAVLVGFAAGAGEIARYVGRHGTDRVAGVVLVAPVTPYLRRTADNPDGVASSTFDALRAGSLADRSQLYQDLADGPFFGLNRPGAEVSTGIRDDFWRQAMQAGHHNALEAIAAFADTDFRADLAAFDVPTLVIHGEHDQIVPVAAGGRATAASVPGSTLIVYEGAPHGLTHTHARRLTGDLLDFVSGR